MKLASRERERAGGARVGSGQKESEGESGWG